VQVVNVQSSRWSAAGEVQFTINVGVFFPEVHTLMDLGYGPGPRGPKESECTLRERIGMLMPGGEDRWWTVRPGSWLRALDGNSPERIAEELRDASATFAKPWLDRLSDLRVARDEAERTDALFVSAACSLVLGDDDEARRSAARLAREAPQATAALAWARRRGLLP
jgi:hypothetical protein